MLRRQRVVQPRRADGVCIDDLGLWEARGKSRMSVEGAGQWRCAHSTHSKPPYLHDLPQPLEEANVARVRFVNGRRHGCVCLVKLPLAPITQRVREEPVGGAVRTGQQTIHCPTLLGVHCGALVAQMRELGVHQLALCLEGLETQHPTPPTLQ